MPYTKLPDSTLSWATLEQGWVSTFASSDHRQKEPRVDHVKAR